jgi:penicillin-insensitive murein DD-endopeptidase
MRSAKNSLAILAAALVALSLTSGTATLAQSAEDKDALANMAGSNVAETNAAGQRVQPASAGGLPTDAYKVPAKKLFGRQKGPANIKARAIGTYAKGCLAGARAVPINGDAWQVMRLSRNRNWGHPDLVALLEQLAKDARSSNEWNGLLIGDLSQPRGGPMLTGHASHQIGLDADVWLTPMPDRVLSKAERENISARIVVKNRKEIDPEVWTENHARLIKRAASFARVGRIFVHPPIKAELCKWAKGDRAWLAKVRPLYGHNYHFHIRMKCPAGLAGCKDQWTPKPKDGTGCGEELDYWMSDVPWVPKKRDPSLPPVKPQRPPPPLTLSGLPAECRAVIAAQ